MNVALICNPRAGRGEGEGALDAAVAVLEAAGWDVDPMRTEAPGDARRFATEAVEAGKRAVLVAGGDGTINEALQALAGTDTALGYLPFGTVNVWARELGLPLDPVEAARALVTGHTERLDLGMAGDRYFLLMAGIGFDAEVVRRAQGIERHKARWGVLPYVASGLATAPLYRGADIELRWDSVIRRVEALMLVVGNTRLYAGRFALTPTATANDGWLDLCIVKGSGPISLARQSLPLLLLRSIKRADVELVRIKELSVRSDMPLPIQVDGELAGTTPITIRVAPRALSAIVPHAFASNLIA